MKWRERLERLRDLTKPSLAPSTEEVYRKHSGYYAAWTDENGLDPPTWQSLALFLESQHSRGLAAVYLRNSMAAVRWAYPAVADQLLQREPAAMIKNLLANSRRITGGAPKQAKAIRAQEFRQILDCKYVKPRWRAMIALMRDAMLRSNELVSIRYRDLEPNLDGSATLHITKSKTDQFSAGATVFVSAHTIRLLKSAGIDVGRDDTDKIFNFSTRFVRRQIAAVAFAAKLPGSFDPVLGVPAPGYAGHRPRVGMTIDLADAGFSLLETQLAGRWSSPKYARLLCPAEGGAGRRGGPVA